MRSASRSAFVDIATTEERKFWHTERQTNRYIDKKKEVKFELEA